MPRSTAIRFWPGPPAWTGHVKPSRVELAVLNSARWYEAMFAAHGLAYEADGRVWLSHQTPPPFHSNLVVLSPATSQKEVEAHVAVLGKQPRPAGWSVKDSYACLDLSGLGFALLFQADWIWRDPRQPSAPGAVPGLVWSRVAGAPALMAWERAWAGDPRNDGLVRRTRHFPDQLLASPDHALFAGRRDDEIVAGGIANRSPGVVGLSNIFSPPEIAAATWFALVASTSAAFPNIPLVGYERGADLQIARAVGFLPIGRLNVWCRAA